MDRRHVRPMEGALRLAAAAPYVLHQEGRDDALRTVRRELQNSRRHEPAGELPVQLPSEGGVPAGVRDEDAHGRHEYRPGEAQENVEGGHTGVLRLRIQARDADEADENGMESAAVREGEVYVRSDFTLHYPKYPSFVQLSQLGESLENALGCQLREKSPLHLTTLRRRLDHPRLAFRHRMGNERSLCHFV